MASPLYKAILIWLVGLLGGVIWLVDLLGGVNWLVDLLGGDVWRSLLLQPSPIRVTTKFVSSALKKGNLFVYDCSDPLWHRSESLDMNKIKWRHKCHGIQDLQL